MANNSDTRVLKTTIDNLVPDDKNFNKGTEVGNALLEKSLRKLGAGRSVVVDKNNRIIAGNKTIENAAAIGMEDVIIVETTGDKIVAVKRIDIDLDSKKGRELALADNSTQKANLDWDNSILSEVASEWEIETKEWGVFLDEETSEESDSGSGSGGSLMDRFVVPPFSVLDTRQGYWQDRKNKWMEIIGDTGATRENTNMKALTMQYPQAYAKYNKIRSKNPDLTFEEYLKTNCADIIGKGVFSSGTSNFDPVLAEAVMTWFCPKGGSVIDPFGGEQVKGFVAGQLGLEYEAVEFRDEQVQFNRERTQQFPAVKYVTGDSNNISTLIERRGFDLCFTSPPYYDLEVYSKEDMSALGTYEEFMAQYENIFRQCYELLADNAFLAVKIGEIRDRKTGEYRNFVGDNITIFKRIGFKYYNEIILLNTVGSGALRASNSMKTRKVVKVHQNILVFYKGDLSKIKDKYPEIKYTKEEINEWSETKSED